MKLVEPRPLRGELKLGTALETFRIDVAGRTALDVGAAAGGFTSALLKQGACKVYAVDAGFGQLRGSLRQDPRVVNLERINLGALDRQVVPEQIELITIDVSYVALARAVPQLERVEIARGADLVALVKPMFELGAGGSPLKQSELDSALERAVTGVQRVGWCVLGSFESPIAGARGATEFWLHARF